jgi:DNA repair exonuclease SbcCD ATPase subunit
MVINKYVIIPQEAIARLFDLPSKRKAELQRLFGTADAEIIRELLQKELSSISVVNNGPRITELTTYISQVTVELAAAEAKLRDSSKYIIPSATLVTKRAAIAEFHQRARSAIELKALEAELSTLYKHMNAGAEELKVLSDNETRLETEAAAARLLYDTARPILDKVSSIRSTRARLAELTAEGQQLSANAEALKPPSENPASYKAP